MTTPLDVLALLAKMRGTSLEEEIKRYNADIERRIANGDIHPVVSAEERMARTRAVKRRALDKAKAARAAARALKPIPSADELAALADVRKARKKASARKHRVKVRDARRLMRARRKAHGLPLRPLREPTIAGVQREISRMLALLRSS